jgi:hypothetical protein
MAQKKYSINLYKYFIPIIVGLVLLTVRTIYNLSVPCPSGFGAIGCQIGKGIAPLVTIIISIVVMINSVLVYLFARRYKWKYLIAYLILTVALISEYYLFKFLLIFKSGI